ncbi:MAG: hypothetical protein PVF55_02075 [Desulfobacterales bacterium]
MANRPGKIVLMGSGELTATMVEVHKGLLDSLPRPARAVFLDTPAGFQLNVNQIAAKAVDYFSRHVQYPLDVASFKSHTQISDYDRQQAASVLRQADYILIGPGSPTYAVRQWQPSKIPDYLADCVIRGGILVAASAAALTVGRFTLPVYEIYKVGQELHWVAGLDLLARFGLNLVVVPHWNNAEGGTHDTRFCFMGAERFDALETLLPEPRPVLGLDEHTACILDLATSQVEVRGIGGITLRTLEGTATFQSGERFELAVLRDGLVLAAGSRSSPKAKPAPPPGDEHDDFWQQVHGLEAHFHEGLADNDARSATNALLELDRCVWQAQQGIENEDVVTQARDNLREMMAVLGNHLATASGLQTDALAPLVDALLELRQKLRRERQWEAADLLRDALDRVDIQVEDTPEGHRWHFRSP